MAETGASSYKFNSFQEIKSHSSILYNERMAILFYLLDMKSLEMNETQTIESIYKVRSIIRQIYKNIRMLLRFNPTVRATMHLETKDEGIYVIDIVLGTIDKMLAHCKENGFTERKIDIIMQELDNAEMMIKDVMQYFQYFIRPDFRQKPDVEVATERYKEMADARTIEELRAIVGKNHSVDFASLGSERIELKNKEIEYDPHTDGSLDEYKDEDEELYLDYDEEDDEDEDK